MSAPAALRPAVALVGARGHGANHLRHVCDLHAAGRSRLVGVCDTALLDAAARAALPAGAARFDDHRDLLRRARPEVVVVATPPHTHLDIAADAVAAGADLLLEKPPLAGLAEHDRLDALLRRAGRRCQVGFQSLGSPALAALLDAVGRGRLGEVAAIACTGTWIRTDAYWARSPWAGRRFLDGRPVTDGAISNPFAHSLMNALAVAAAAGGAGPAEPAAVEPAVPACSRTSSTIAPTRTAPRCWRRSRRRGRSPRSSRRSTPARRRAGSPRSSSP